MKNSVLVTRYQCCFCSAVVSIQNIIVIASEIIIPSKCRTWKLVLVVGKAVKGARNFKCEDLQLGL